MLFYEFGANRIDNTTTHILLNYIFRFIVVVPSNLIFHFTTHDEDCGNNKFKIKVTF